MLAGMLLQIPLIAMGKSFSGTRRGNLLVWWSLFSGQVRDDDECTPTARTERVA